MNYIGEHSWAGYLGNIFLILSFTATLLSLASYFIAANNPVAHYSWKKIGRIAFRIHSFAVIGIMTMLFIMLANHYFEFHYVWKHSNRAMPMKYIFSCFWEGQEGSFLLWTLWNVVLGNILIRSSKEWEAHVMTVFALAQIFLASMLLGIYVGNIHIGSNPFLLYREMPENIGMPWTKIQDYLTKLKLFRDGQGLNPLLQNYWMTIHPPTLFLGFASTLVPFSYAIAALWKKKLTEWQQFALPWTYFGIMILGTGILMGGAWAYESLTFGGFWAWDPVENASLVPWLTFVGAGHVMLINKNRNVSIFMGFFLTIISFILVLYSTFLTRSGILGDTSVHAFTDLGMSGQLMIYLLFFVWLSVNLLLLNGRLQLFYSIFTGIFFVLAVVTAQKTAFTFSFILLSAIVLVAGYRIFFPKDKQEEDLWTREFWMFIGAIVLLVASFQVILYTSFPVINKIATIDFVHTVISGIHNKLHSWFNYDGLANVVSGKLAPERNAIAFYNKWQSLFAILICSLIGFGQYLKYKNTPLREFGRRLILPLAVSVVLAILIGLGLPRNNNLQYFLNEFLLFACLFAILGNLNYWKSMTKGKLSKSGSSIAHIGFGLIIIGALLSNSKKEIISRNTSGKDITVLDKELSNSNSILLTKGDTLPMGNYFVTFTGRRKDGIYIYFDVKYLRKELDGKFVCEFILNPFVQLNDRMGNVPEPSTEHFLTRDIYTHLKWVDLSPDISAAVKDEYSQPVDNNLKLGDTVFTSNCILVLKSWAVKFDKKKYGLADSVLAVEADFSAYTMNGKVYELHPVYTIQNNESKPIEAVQDELGVKLNFWKVDPDQRKIGVYLSEKKSNKRDFIVMEAMIFPWINILWIGCIVMITGTFISIRSRLQKKQ